MKTIKNGTTLAATAVVWTAALASAVALVHVLNRALSVVDETIEAATIEAPAALARSAEESLALDLRTATLVTPRPVVLHAVAPRHLDISEMRCADWRELDMGSGRVQICD